MKALLGTYSTLTGRDRVYEVADGIEIDASEQYEISRRDILFTDVLLVTIHRELGIAYVLAHTIIAFILLGVAALIWALAGFNAGVATFLILGTPSLIALVLRLLSRVDVVTIYGRRSKGRIRFSFRKERAREVYRRICERAAEAQKVETAPPAAEETAWA